MNNLAVIFHDRKNYGEAEKYYKMAIENDSTKSIYFYNLGLCYRDQEKYTEALKYFLLAHKLGNKDATIEIIDLMDKKTIRYTILEMYSKILEENGEFESKNKSLTDENTHLKYVPNAPGYLEEKDHFDKCVINK